MGKRGHKRYCSEKWKKMQCIIHTVFQPLLKFLPCMQCQQKFWKWVVLGCSNPHIAGVPSICGSCLTTDPATWRHYIVQVVLKFSGIPWPYHNSIFSLCLSSPSTLLSALVITLPWPNGIAKLGHTGTCTQAAKDCALPVQLCLSIISTDCTIVKCKLGG